MIKEFKDFVFRGNVLDLAVGVIIGGAFTAIVTSAVNNLINPLIGIFLPGGALAKASFTIGKAKFMYGAFLNDVINFLITALVIFLMIKAINKLLPKKEEVVEEDAPVVNEELDTLKEIRDLLSKQN
jgi:large conductance mechanosensitive channel